MERRERLLLEAVIVRARLVERDRLIDAAAERTVPDVDVFGDRQLLPVIQRPVHSGEHRIRDGLPIEAAHLCARRVETVLRAENVHESRQRVARHAARDLVGRRLNQPGEQRFVRVPAVERDEDVRAVAHDRPADAAAPLERVELPLRARARLKVGSIAERSLPR